MTAPDPTTLLAEARGLLDESLHALSWTKGRTAMTEGARMDVMKRVHAWLDGTPASCWSFLEPRDYVAANLRLALCSIPDADTGDWYRLVLNWCDANAGDCQPNPMPTSTHGCGLVAGGRMTICSMNARCNGCERNIVGSFPDGICGNRGDCALLAWERAIATAREEGRAAGAEEMRERAAMVVGAAVESFPHPHQLASILFLKQLFDAIRALATTPAPEPAVPTPGDGDERNDEPDDRWGTGAHRRKETDDDA